MIGRPICRFGEMQEQILNLMTYPNGFFKLPVVKTVNEKKPGKIQCVSSENRFLTSQSE